MKKIVRILICIATVIATILLISFIYTFVFSTDVPSLFMYLMVIVAFGVGKYVNDLLKKKYPTEEKEEDEQS